MNYKINKTMTTKPKREGAHTKKFRRACESDDLKTVDEYLDTESLWIQVDFLFEIDLKALIHQLIFEENTEVIRRLFDHATKNGVNIGLETDDNHSRSVFYNACNASMSMFSLFVNNPMIDVNARFIEHRTQFENYRNDKRYEHSPLSFLIKNRMNEKAKLLLRRSDIDVNRIDSYGETPLHEACRSNNVEMLRELSKNENLDWNSAGKRGTAFMVACDENNMEVIREMKKLKPIMDLIRGSFHVPSEIWPFEYRQHKTRTIKVVVCMATYEGDKEIDLSVLCSGWDSISWLLDQRELRLALDLMRNPSIDIIKHSKSSLLDKALELREPVILRQVLKNSSIPEFSGSIIDEKSVKEILASRHYKKFNIALGESEGGLLWGKKLEEQHIKSKNETGLDREYASEMIILINMVCLGLMKMKAPELVPENIKTFLELVIQLPKELSICVVCKACDMKVDNIRDIELLNALDRLCVAHW